MIRPSDPGCRVFDDGRAGPCGLFLDEHYLIDGRWVHPVLDDATGYYVRPRDEDDFCHRLDGACSGRACWICAPETKENV